ncbi:hypothetical protein BaRGS_00021963 [Batillaria attramentaria]|uniref:Uncharacterized protein n=1 Tax=Batillaria attramentaria TaxID=370345 RepID=A0ABD0KIN0_9CAEN
MTKQSGEGNRDGLRVESALIVDIRLVNTSGPEITHAQPDAWGPRAHQTVLDGLSALHSSSCGERTIARPCKGCGKASLTGSFCCAIQPV